MRQYDTTELVSDFKEAIATLEAEKRAAQEPRPSDDDEDTEPRPIEEIDAAIRASQALLAFFQENKTITHQQLIEFRDAAVKRGQEKHQPGGPYEAIPEYKMYKTEEGRIVTACADLFQQMNVLNFL